LVLDPERIHMINSPPTQFADFPQCTEPRIVLFCFLQNPGVSGSGLSSITIVLFHPRPCPCRPCPHCRCCCPRCPRCRPPHPCRCPPCPRCHPPHPCRRPPHCRSPRHRHRLFVIICLSRHCGGAWSQHSGGGGCHVDSCRNRAADALPAAADNAALPKSCRFRRCRRRRRAATALSAAVLPRITPRCHRQPPLPGCHCPAADAAAALQPPPLLPPPLPCRPTAHCR
jgi:hypothetical protein